MAQRTEVKAVVKGGVEVDEHGRKVCGIEGCSRPSVVTGANGKAPGRLCRNHYNRWREGRSLPAFKATATK